jgi:hypothetical protein
MKWQEVRGNCITRSFVTCTCTCRDQQMKLGGMRRAGHVARMGRRTHIMLLVVKH